MRRLLPALLSIAIAFSVSFIASADDRGPKELVVLAMSLNQQARYAEAADLLERALMLNPDTPNALIEYQKALLGMQVKQTQVTISHSLRSMLKSNWHVSKQLYAKIGASDNLNRAPSSRDIPITLAGESINVLLTQDQRPKSGQGIEVGVMLDGYSRLNSTAELSVTAEVLQRAATESGFTHYQWGKLATSWLQELPVGRQIVWGLAADIINYRNEPPFYVLQGTMRYIFERHAQCQRQLGFDIQRQGQQKTAVFDGQYIGGLVAINCHQKNASYALQVSMGRDQASDERLGGDQVKKRLQLTHAWNVGDVISNDVLKTTFSYYQQKEQQGYSLALNNGSKKEIERLDITAAYQFPFKPLGKGWVGTVEMQWIKQQSNIILFETESTEIWFGLAKNW